MSGLLARTGSAGPDEVRRPSAPDQGCELWAPDPLRSVRSVSYTHLDVYKRQLPDRAQGAGGAENPEAAHAAFWKGVSDKAIFGDVKAYDFGPQHPGAIPPGSADFVLVARAFHNWARQATRPTSIYAPSSRSVSYTHLDVYKRQQL